MNKHAYLIIAHNQFQVLELLMKLLDSDYNDLYIHIDKKVKNFDFKKFESFCRKSRVYFLEKRINVKWGTYSQIATELILMEACMQRKYSYVHLISGVDLPIKKAKYIYEFFEQDKYRNYLSLSNKGEYCWSIDMLKYYFIFLDRGRKNKLFRFLSGIFLTLQIKMNFSRKMVIDEVLKGANWFSLTQETIGYILKRKKDIKKMFNYSNCADELFVPTILNGSKYFENLAPHNMRYIKWIEGKKNPEILTEQDYKKMIESEFLFARKFNYDVDKNVVDKIYNELREDLYD